MPANAREDAAPRCYIYAIIRRAADAGAAASPACRPMKAPERPPSRTATAASFSFSASRRCRRLYCSAAFLSTSRRLACSPSFLFLLLDYDSAYGAMSTAARVELFTPSRRFMSGYAGISTVNTMIQAMRSCKHSRQCTLGHILRYHLMSTVKSSRLAAAA